MINYNYVDTCPVCLSSETTHFIEFKDSHQFIDSYNKFSMQKNICNKCGHIYVSSCHDYDIEGHYETARGRGDLIYSKSSEIVQDEFHDLVDWISDSFDDPKKVIDIGCGKCELLNAFQTRYESSEVHGIDYSKDSIEYGKLFGLNSIIAGDLYSELPENSDYDIVSATGVLEHQYDLGKFLQLMKSLANDDAYFLIQVPDSYSIAERDDLGSKYMHDLYNDEHIHHFNLRNLSYVLELNGFEVVKNRVTRRNDWDLIDILFRKNKNLVKPSIENSVADDSIKFLNEFERKRSEDKAKIKKIIDRSKSTGIYGGGWHTAVCLPSYYNISFKEIDCIFDLDKRKQGKKLLGVEVIEPSKQNIDQIDALIISSINLNDNISKFLMDIGVDKEKIVSLY